MGSDVCNCNFTDFAKRYTAIQLNNTAKLVGRPTLGERRGGGGGGGGQPGIVSRAVLQLLGDMGGWVWQGGQSPI